MAFTGLDVFDRAVHRADEWLKYLRLTLGWDDRHDVYGAFVSVLRALRDRLPHAELGRLGRTNYRNVLSPREEESYVGERILEELESRDETATVSFREPDALVVVETVSTRGGIAILERDDLDRYPFLGVE